MTKASNMRPGLILRHNIVVRVTHWLNVVAILLLLGTGLNIFNAHPFLYWGQKGSSVDAATRWLAIGAVQDGTGGQGTGGYRGLTIIGSTTFDTTGLLGLSRSTGDGIEFVAFPAWSTLPGARNLGLARNWHFAAAWLLVFNGLVYLVHGSISGHIRNRLLPKPHELRPRFMWDKIFTKTKMIKIKSKTIMNYNLAQKIAYSSVVFIVFPLIILSGLGMSPAMDASSPWILDLLGGRQSARSMHFAAAVIIVLFIMLHLLMLLLSGPWRLMRGMVTGWQTVERRP